MIKQGFKISHWIQCLSTSVFVSSHTAPISLYHPQAPCCSHLPALFYCLSFPTTLITVQLFGPQNALPPVFSSTSKPLCYFLFSVLLIFHHSHWNKMGKSSSRGRGVLPLDGAELIVPLPIVSLGLQVQENQGKDFDCQHPGADEPFFRRQNHQLPKALTQVSFIQLPYADTLQWTAPSVIKKFIVKRVQVCKCWCPPQEQQCSWFPSVVLQMAKQRHSLYFPLYPKVNTMHLTCPIFYPATKCIYLANTPKFCKVLSSLGKNNTMLP